MCYCLIEKAKRGGPPGRVKSKVRVVVTEKRLNAMRDAMAKPIQVDLVNGISTIKDNVGMDELRRIFMSGDYDPLMQKLGPSMEGSIRRGMRKAMDTTSKHTHASMPELSDVPLVTHEDSGKPRMRGALAMDHTNPRLQTFIRATTGNLITTSEDGLHEAVKSVTAQSFGKGMSIQQAASTLRGSIGLNGPQVRALNNFQRNLDPKMSATARAAAIDSQSDRMLNYRASMIAHTEIRNAQNQSQLEVWRQAADEGHIGKRSEKSWQVDGDPCEEWCEQMQAKSVLLDSSWRVVNTRNRKVKEVQIPSWIHPHCQCIMLLKMA